MLAVFTWSANKTQNALSTLGDETWWTDCPQLKKRVLHKNALSVKTRRLYLSSDFYRNFGEPGRVKTFIFYYAHKPPLSVNTHSKL
tara:strand:+ start:27 stop:284 length:258 start_codon:yes stop_codon:yes gene_type:complete